MPLVSMKELLAEARKGGYAVSYCESWNLESLQAVLETAVELDSPIIAGFSGRFLMDPGRAKPEELKYYAGMTRIIEDLPVPVALLLNETDSLPQIQAAIDLGFNSIMVENERLSFSDYRDLVRRVVALSSRSRVSVEAQVGNLPCGSCDGEPGQTTDPDIARAFVEDTGVDALAVSVGNVHILTEGVAAMNLDTIDRIRAKVGVPLVLHGGTGIPRESAQAIIHRGIAKFNFGTVLKQAFLRAVRDRLTAYTEPMSPHPFVGMGGPEDVLVAGREAMASEVRQILLCFGSAGRASGLKPLTVGTNSGGLS